MTTPLDEPDVILIPVPTTDPDKVPMEELPPDLTT